MKEETVKPLYGCRNSPIKTSHLDAARKRVYVYICGLCKRTYKHIYMHTYIHIPTCPHLPR